MQDKVRQFMLVSEQECPEKPVVPSYEIRKLRATLIMEEVLELLTALGFELQVVDPVNNEFELKHINHPNLLGIADGITDTMYVVVGTAVACGINAQSVFDEVHRSNMSKCWTSTEVANATYKDAQELYQAIDITINGEDGIVYKKIGKNKWLVKDSNGKVIKSPSYSAADIASKLT